LYESLPEQAMRISYSLSEWIYLRLTDIQSKSIDANRLGESHIGFPITLDIRLDNPELYDEQR
jgi:hypothetical protein